MKAPEIIKNQNGNQLLRLKISKTRALYREIGTQARRFTGKYFVAPIESRDGMFGPELHLSGGLYWESTGHYAESESAAMDLFNE